ncbi:putative lipase atg15 [Gryganskiella cystojenkinii]|nr:putative lipase atg15 [Gryganskiella cystojenkinii]
MKTLSCVVTVACCAVLAISSLPSQTQAAFDPWHPPQLPFSWPKGKPHTSPPPSSTSSFVSKKETFRLQHILAHGAPGAKSAKVFRRLEVNDQLRVEMASVNIMAGASSSSPGSTFEHTLKDAFFPLNKNDVIPQDHDSTHWETNNNNFPLPWKRVPNPEDHQTVIAMTRMALDCYVDPARQGWVDIGDNWEVETEIGWLEAGLRGYIFASEDQKTVVIGIKGTSLKLFGTGGGPTGNNDKLNDNKMFSCCCGKVDRTWWGVCGCYMGGNQCNQQCLVDDLKKDLTEEESYVGIGLKVVEAAKVLYPHATIWLTGHSLGGSVAAMIGVTHGYPVFTFQSPGDKRYAQRIGLVKSNMSIKDHEKLAVWQFGHSADPVYMGTCNGAASTCYSAGYALETKCHVGRFCNYDTMAELGWRQNIQAHTILTFINVVENWPNMTKGRETVPECTIQDVCDDCAQWEYV